jgi:hypothetical protein
MFTLGFASFDTFPKRLKVKRAGGEIDEVAGSTLDRTGFVYRCPAMPTCAAVRRVLMCAASETQLGKEQIRWLKRAQRAGKRMRGGERTRAH